MEKSPGEIVTGLAVTVIPSSTALTIILPLASSQTAVTVAITVSFKVKSTVAIPPTVSAKTAESVPSVV